MKNRFRPLTRYSNKRPCRRVALVGLFLVALILGFSREALAFSVYGMPLSKAYSKDFFQFFKFRVVGVSITDDGFMEIIFKPPKGDPRRTSVELLSTTPARACSPVTMPKALFRLVFMRMITLMPDRS